MAFFRTMFFSGCDGVYHPLFRETTLLKNLKRRLKLFEVCIRHFEETYIMMIKDLKEKTHILNLDAPIEESIVLKKRESSQKLVENQIFDRDGNFVKSL